MISQAPLEQSYLLEQLIPEMTRRGQHYRKCKSILARKADPGEKIETFTSTGKETENFAEPGDYVVKSKTKAGEQYIIRQAKFGDRYAFASKVDDVWNEYTPRGEILAILVDSELLERLERDSTFTIMPNWNKPQIVNEGDYLVTPLPAMQEIYRISRPEFEETYKLVQ